MPNPYTESPVNPLPSVVVALALPLLAVELLFTLGSRGLVGGPEAVGWRLAAIQEFGFYGPVLELMVEANRWPLEHLQRIVTYPFIHVGFTHMLMVLVFLLALGKMVGEVFSSLAVLLVFFVSAITGAVVYTFATEANAPLVGGYPAVYGLIGAFTYIMWGRLGEMGAPQVRAFYLIGFLLFVQLVFGLLFGGGLTWVADVSGFAAGFALSFLVAPGGWRRALGRLRQR